MIAGPQVSSRTVSHVRVAAGQADAPSAPLLAAREYEVFGWACDLADEQGHCRSAQHRRSSTAHCPRWESAALMERCDTLFPELCELFRVRGGRGSTGVYSIGDRQAG